MDAEPTATPIQRRFMAAATSGPPSDKQRETVKKLREATVLLAEYIDDLVPAGRNKSLALTALEDVQMRANRGVFADVDDR